VGYRSATLREICRRGNANIAAVNYHFRDKEQLYLAVWERAVAGADDDLMQSVPDAALPAEEKLRYFIHHLLHSLLGAERPMLLLRLFAHEMVEPTPALDLTVEKAARPLNNILAAIVREILGAAAEPRDVRDAVSSILAQCSSYQCHEAVVQRLHQLNIHDPATIEQLAGHIYRFSLGGLRAIAEHSRSPAPRKAAPKPARAQRQKVRPS